MIPTIGLMIGLYILARYSEMTKNAGVGTKIILAIFSLITLICMAGLFLSSANMPTIPSLHY